MKTSKLSKKYGEQPIENMILLALPRLGFPKGEKADDIRRSVKITCWRKAQNRAIVYQILFVLWGDKRVFIVNPQ
ncbi:hypothetical protein Dpoa2040_003481 [Dickeya sp. CFBP 2040]|uniref:Uncharacterized protein n=2 Tax=Dickeya poaceiphila TaxID=568768 RepID=A0A5B8HSQ7_9GAMM|nr:MULTISPECIES: hypothetical protein [Dickeya]NKI76143.1 hypothetical protein [Dickeya sp. CFBP 2040]QDX31619.1 hypothetical protein Dpoa569_0003670 [Dickeya poaceiphila]